MNYFKYFLLKIIKRPLSIRSVIHLFYFFDWKASLSDNRAPLNDGFPWITFYSRAKIQSLLKSHFTVFEFGGGGSSVFFAKYAKQVYTVEHDTVWLDLVSSKITELKRVNWKGVFIPPQNLDKKLSDYSDPTLFLSADLRYENMSFEKYVSYIDNFPSEYFDMVFIDGRARPSCIKKSLNKIKKNGFMILDNSERLYYLKTFNLNREGFKLVFNDFGPGPYAREFWQTTIWKKTNS
jgi:hypothetical protein